jgi:tetraacyldisaccharide 4'-kinase
VTDRVTAWNALIRGTTRGPAAALTRAGLWWARLPYAAGVRVRNGLFDAGWKRATGAGVPVVSVGNLTLGGTGKTPCVEYVAGFYRDLGLQAAILSRGYGSTDGRPNDEAMVLEDNLPDVPHLQGRDRVALAATAVEELESEILVLDDGFQHRRLARDLDIVLIDATRPLCDEYLFPRGTLREPVSGLKRAGLAVLTRCDQTDPGEVEAQRDWLHTRFPELPVATTAHAPLELVGTEEAEAVESLRGRTVGGFCGIGNPAAFRRTLDDLGANVTAFRTFADHHPYSRADVDDLRRWAETLPRDATICTTQKDFVKLRIPELAGRPVRAVRIGMRFLDGEETVRETLSRVTG